MQGHWRGSARMWWAIALVALAGMPCADVARAAAPDDRPDPCEVSVDTNHLVADATRPGLITLYFYNAAGARVTYFECFEGRLKRLGAKTSDPSTPTILAAATTWSCDRPERRFVAGAKLANGSWALGTYSVRTGSCAHRFKLGVPRRVAPGSKARVRVVDRWGIGGIRSRLCVTAPQAGRTCQPLRFRDAVAVATRRVRATARGRWDVELRVRKHRVRTSFAVGGEAGSRRTEPPTVLATGDSLMQGVDRFLEDELGDAANVYSDVRPGSRISAGDDWAKHSVAQTRRLRQAITVISVGAASDGLPMPTATGVLQVCCDDAWILQYSRRVRRMMRTYLRGGGGRVFWLTLPTPRHGPRALIAAAVNTAVVRAAEDLKGVTVVRMDEIFSPDGYSETIRYRGRDVDVREPDGVHLNISGTAIAAKAVARAIRER